jgi:hypothetical protein
MKYTALFMIISGVVIACFAGVRYAIGEPSDWAENPFVLGLALPLVFASALVTTGTALWVMGRRGCTVWGSASGPFGRTGTTKRNWQ